MQCWFRKDKQWRQGILSTAGDMLIIDYTDGVRHCCIGRPKYCFSFNTLEIDGFIPNDLPGDCEHVYYEIRFTEPEPYSG